MNAHVYNDIKGLYESFITRGQPTIWESSPLES